MSVFICSDNHINALAQWAENDDKQHVAELLRVENTRAFNIRYSENNSPLPITFEPSAQLSPVKVLKLCDCFDYQCSETDDYPQTEAARTVNAIRHQAISRLPGYDDADWSLF